MAGGFCCSALASVRARRKNYNLPLDSVMPHSDMVFSALSRLGEGLGHHRTSKF